MNETRAWVYGSVIGAGSIAAVSELKVGEAGELAGYIAGVMFAVWLAHGFAAVVATQSRVDRPGWGSRAVGAFKGELGILESVAPALAAIIAVAILGGSLGTASFVGLGVAVATMLAVTVTAARGAGASTRAALGMGLVALVLGGVIIAAKVIFG